MNNLKITTYKGFSKVKDEITIEEFFSSITGKKHEAIIQKIAWLTKEDRIKEANNVKRQLAFFTFTTNYHTERLPESIKHYNDLITIDIDHLTDEQVVHFRPIIEQDPHTIGYFLTAKQHGFKIFAHLNTATAGGLRKSFLQVERIPYAELEKYHASMYELTRLHYENLLGIEVDTSGKDISRGVFASFDPQAFLSTERLAAIPPFTAAITPDTAPKRQYNKSTKDSTVHAAAHIDDIDPAVRLQFNRCVTSTNRIGRYTEGNYNTYLFTLGHKCYLKELNEEEVKVLAAQRFGDNGKWDTDTPIANGYTYTSKTEETEQQLKDKLPLVLRIKHFLEGRYRFQHNVILDRLEFSKLCPDRSSTPFRTMTTRDLNTIYCRLNEAGITPAQQCLRAVIDSDYAEEINPFATYFSSLPPWDGTDYITLLAQTITAEAPAYWHRIFRRWIVGMVACAIGTEEVHQQVLLLYGKQGRGKSTWIRNLLPPELREYYRNGMIDPTNKDDMLLLSTRILINMEEFEGMRQGSIAELKRIISLDNVTLRKVYDIQSNLYIRRASFIGSTNNTQFLKDQSGSRRFLIVHTEHIDYKTKIDYKGLYAQVMHLIQHGFQYWFEGEEIAEINTRNEQYRVKDPLEENLYVYFRPAQSTDYTMKWKPAAAILAHLSMQGRTLANAQSQQLLVQVLERDHFMHRTNSHGITEYAVIALQSLDIEENEKRIMPQVAETDTAAPDLFP